MVLPDLQDLLDPQEYREYQENLDQKDELVTLADPDFQVKMDLQDNQVLKVNQARKDHVDPLDHLVWLDPQVFQVDRGQMEYQENLAPWDLQELLGCKEKQDQGEKLAHQDPQERMESQVHLV